MKKPKRYNIVDNSILVPDVNGQFIEYSEHDKIMQEQLIEFSKFIQMYKNVDLEYDCVEREVEAFLNKKI